jgi:hypothetical protein
VVMLPNSKRLMGHVSGERDEGKTGLAYEIMIGASEVCRGDTGW